MGTEADQEEEEENGGEEGGEVEEVGVGRFVGDGEVFDGQFGGGVAGVLGVFLVLRGIIITVFI